MSTESTASTVGKVHEFSAELVVRRKADAAAGVVALDLCDPDGRGLPAWEPGAHIDLMLGDGTVRQYSLCGDPGDRSTWRIGVLLDPNSRGGSRYVHENLDVGESIHVRGPRNHFSLIDSPRYQFIAGGIGITPLLPMIATAERTGCKWRLLYLGRSAATMAFADELRSRHDSHVTLWPRDEHDHFDLHALLSEPDEDTLIYCCGPEQLLAGVESACVSWPVGSLHIERFTAKTAATDGAPEALDDFKVVCRRSGITLDVSAEQSILEALEDADVPILGSCYEGVCGTCEATVLEGTPVHRDSVLSESQQTSGTVMMTCVSRACTEKIVLDL